MSGGEESRRVQRVEREIREILAQYVIRNLRDELQGLTTVAQVRISKDLKLAKVYVSIMADKNQVEQNLEILNDFIPEMQRELGRALRMKFCPKLKIFLDDTYEQAFHVQNVLQGLKTETDGDSIDKVKSKSDEADSKALEGGGRTPRRK